MGYFKKSSRYRRVEIYTTKNKQIQCKAKNSQILKLEALIEQQIHKTAYRLKIHNKIDIER